MSREAFEKLLAALPDADRQRILRVAHEYGLRPDDPAWVALAAVERGLIALERTLPAIREESAHAARAVREALMQAAHELVRTGLAETVATVSLDVARVAAQRERLRWVAGVLMASLLAVTGALGAGYWLGTREVAGAVTEVKRELPAITAWARDFDTPEKRERASWALSETGARVYRLARLNDDFARLTDCDFGRGVGYTVARQGYTVLLSGETRRAGGGVGDWEGIRGIGI